MRKAITQNLRTKFPKKMASIEPYSNGWRAQVFVQGQRASETFETRREAENWAARKTIELKDQSAGRTGEKKTLLDAMRKFGEEVSPTHKDLPHIHAKYAEFEASINLADGEVLAGELPRKQLRLVQAWIELHKDELMADWELAAAGEQPYKILPL